MALNKIFIFSLVILVISCRTNGQGFPGFGLPSFPGFGSGSGFTGFTFPTLPPFPSFPTIPGFPGPIRRTTTTEAPDVEDTTSVVASSEDSSADSNETTTESNRKRRDVDGDDQEGPQSRLFFTRFPTITSCNTTTEAGNSCRSCTQALRCLPNNFGLLTTCRGLFRHCNNGRCSLSQSAECSTTSSTSSTSSTTTTTTTTSTTVAG